MEILKTENLLGTIKKMEVGDMIATSRKNSVARSAVCIVKQDYDRDFKTTFNKESRQTIITRTR